MVSMPGKLKPEGPYQGFLNDRCVTIAEVLRGAGYRTYMSGKWHVGERPDHWPRQRGFDRYFGVDVPNWPPYCFIENDHCLGIPTEFLPDGLLGNNQASLPGPALAGWRLEDILPTLGDQACHFIEAAAPAKALQKTDLVLPRPVSLVVV